MYSLLLRNPNVQFIPIVPRNGASLLTKESLKVEGAHGDDIVRSAYLDQEVCGRFSTSKIMLIISADSYDLYRG